MSSESARAALGGAPEPPDMPYPEGFSEWPLAKRNAWFAKEAEKDRYFKQLDKVFAEAERSKAQEAPPIILHAFNPADWQGKRALPRKSIVPDYIPDETVTLLYADGGTGKSYLKLQLAVARALAKEWIGLLPEPGRTLVLSTEDDLDEMWRRIEGMIEAETGPFFGARLADLGDIRLVDLVGENSILGLLTRGIIEPTPMYDALDRYMADFKPGLSNSTCSRTCFQAKKTTGRKSLSSSACSRDFVENIIARFSCLRSQVFPA